uniref:BTB/POZ domain-containing protein FBL11 n=1 Tax=Anthurium amnicola TaxID=1678845 RepID=A0A1D1XZ41_9ARAE
MITCSSFADVPYDLLYSCLEHPDLTVYSEKQLCEALLFWITSNEKSSECSCDTAKDYVSILEKVRVLLLPLGYSAGKRRSCYFSGISNESISAIFDLMKEFPEKLFSAIAADGSDNMKIRLTQYSEKVDLAGCAHFTVDLLYLAVLPINSESLCRKRTVRTLVEFKNQHGDNCHTLEKLPTTLSFKAVTEVDMSKCPKMHFGAVINFLHLSFPSLQKLNLSYCAHFKIEGLFSLIQSCPLIDDIDLTVDISPVIRSQVSISSASSEVHQAFEGSPYSTLQHVSVVSNITKLSFEGRTDLDDSGLLNISGLSGSLCYLNLKGCSTVTDVGISKLIQECINIQSIIVSYTSFGMNSILVLCSEKEFPNTSFVVHDNYEYSSTIAFRLRELHMDGCRGIEARHMKRLMRCLFMLRSLSLQETSLADDSLSEYRGFLLEKLDVSETLVSCAAVCHVVRKNPGIRMLKVISCRNLYDIEGIRFNGDASCKDLYGELNQKCLLEEVAFGWGFTSSSIMKIKHAIRGVRAMSVGLGASLDVSILSEICPFIETLVLKFQVISDSDLISILKSLSHLKVLDLCCCLGDLTSKSFQIRMINLKSLRLERVTPWMTNEDLIILTEHCLNLTELSLSGCKLLNSGLWKHNICWSFFSVGLRSY